MRIEFVSEHTREENIRVKSNYGLLEGKPNPKKRREENMKNNFFCFHMWAQKWAKNLKQKQQKYIYIYKVFYIKFKIYSVIR